VLGLDPRTGAIAWQRERTSSRAAYSTPVALGELLVFSSTSHGVFALDPRSGALAWESEPLFRARCVGSPVVAGDLVFASAGQGGGGTESAAVRVPTEESPSAVAWRQTRALPYVPTPLYADGRLYLWTDGGVVSCLDATTGEERWRERVGGDFFGSPVLLGGQLCAIGVEGELCVLAAGDAFAVVARLELGEPSQATPAVWNGRLFLRTETHLVCIRGE
jgi:outer membrane protein assembly factor BamB